MASRLVELAKSAGVKDLHATIKVKFIKALRAEEDGDHAAAKAFLADGVEAEEKFNAAKR